MVYLLYQNIKWKVIHLRLLKLFISSIGILFSAFVSVGYLLTNRMMFIKKKDPSTIYEREILLNDEQRNWYERVPKKDIQIDSKHGYTIHATVIQTINAPRYVVFSHGVTETRLSSIQFAMLFEQFGYNAIIYDQRRHGNSGGKTTSFGYYEKVDLQAVVQYVKHWKGPDVEIGVHGVSMGAATAILYGGTYEHHPLSFIVADCPFSSFSKQITHIAQGDTSPYWTERAVQLANLFIHWRDGYTLSEVSPIRVVDKVDVPILFIHTLEDTFILPEMSEDLYEAAKEPKQLVLLPKGKHALGYRKNREAYRNAIADFLQHVKKD